MKKLLLTLIVSLAMCGSIFAQYVSHWPDFYYIGYHYQAPCVAAIMINGEIVTANNHPANWNALEIAFFVGDECRGAGVAFGDYDPFVNYLTNEYVEDYGDPFPIIDAAPVFYDNEGEVVTVKMYDHVNGIEYNECTITLVGEPFVILTGEHNLQGWDDPENPILLNFTYAQQSSPGTPTVTTSSVSNIAAYTATCGGNVTSDGGATVTARGVCWSTAQNPTVNDSHTTNGTGTGAFTSSITGLTPNTTYYVRAYATNSAGTSYGTQKTFTTSCNPVEISITGTATVIYGQSATLTASGASTYLWNTGSTNATITVSPTETTTYTVTGTNQYGCSSVAGMTVTVNATDSLADGQPCPGTPTVTDIDGNVYNTVQIGNQCWMKENLRTTHYANGTEIPLGTTISYDMAYRYAPNNNASNITTFAYLYNWSAVMHGASSSNANPSGVQGICPIGWHVPSDAEWTQLTNYVSSQSEYTCGGNNANIAKALAANTGWNTSTTTCAVGNDQSSNNATGFNALPAGEYNGAVYNDFGYAAYFWSSTQHGNDGSTHATGRILNEDDYASVGRYGYYKGNGFSVRCLRDSNPTGGETPQDTIGPTGGQTCPGTPTVTDIDGNVYNTVQIGNQCWMKENLRTTKKPDGSDIALKSGRYYPNNNANNVADYGYLYTWPAMMNGASSSDANPSGVRGICPVGWHVPSDSEWTQLKTYLSSQSEYLCNSNTNYIAKALAATTGWNTSTTICHVGNDQNSNNATGFGALPAGAYYGAYYGYGICVHFWSATRNIGNEPNAYVLNYNTAYVNRFGYTDQEGHSVRCIRDENSAVDTSECFNDCHSGSCGEYGNAMYTAAQRLCHLGIVEGINDALQPDTNITRAQLAKVALYGLYNGPHNVPSPLVSDFFPSIYPDLQVDTAYYYRPAKALLYLEYGDGVSPFDRDRSVFNPKGKIERCLVLKVLLETFNITPVSGGTNVFDDYGPSGYTSSKFWGYAQKAYDLGIVQTTHFRPNEYCTRGEAFLYLYRILTNGSINRPTPVNTEDPATSDFFIPTNLSPKVVNAMRGMEYGNFNYYEKDFFNIPGYVNLDFGVSYNSYLTEMPDDFYPVKPLGKAWSHTYNMYMNVVTDYYNNRSIYVFHMPDGRLLMYSDSSGTLSSLTEGNYSTISPQTPSASSYTLTSTGQITYTFTRQSVSDGIYYLTQVKDRNNNAITINIGSGVDHYRITSVTTLGRTLNFYYNSGTDLLSQVKDPADRNVYFYYTDGQPSSLKDAKSQTTYFTYGTSDAEKGLLTEITLPRGNKVYNGYRQRKLTSMSRTSSTGSTFTDIALSLNYPNGTSSSTVTENLNDNQNVSTSYTMNSKNRITRVTSGSHTDLSYQYNVSGKPDLISKATNNKSNVQATFTYNDKGKITEQTVTAGGQSLNTSITYTALNDIHTITDANGNTTTYEYSNGNLSSITDALGHTTSITNNSHGLPTQVTNPMGVITKFTYNSYGNTTSISIPSLSLSSSVSYDGVSRPISSTDFNDNTTTYSYDNNDNLLTTTDALNHTTSFTYDANDNMTKITNALGYSTNISYDNNDFMTALSFQGATRSYSYNRDGTLATYTSPNGHTFSYTYNSNGELTSDGYASYSYNSKGQLSTVTRNSNSISYSYDAFGRVSSISYDGKTVSYTYDNVGNLMTIVYPGNKTVTYQYDAANRMTSVTDWNDHTTTYTYRNDNQLSRVQYPNNVRTTYSYDNSGRRTGMTTVRNNGSGATIVSYNFTLDNNGNHTQESITEPFSSYPAIPSQSTNYTYNNANRLTAAGNTSFGYDDNGNTTSKTGRTMSYDIANMLTGVSGDFSASYVYDGLGNRRSATRSGSTTKYVLNLLAGNPTVLMETTSGGSAQNYYIYGADGLVSRIGSDGSTTRYYVYDYRGSTVAMTDATTSANITHKYQYDEFGKVLQSEEADNNLFRYVGKYGLMYETEDLYFVRARYYDPSIGRFLSEDPIWSTNLYPYADNNPIMRIDANGCASADIDLDPDEWLETMLENIDDTSQPINPDQLSQDMYDDMVNGNAFVGGGAKTSAGNAEINYLEHIPYNTIETTYKEVKNWGNGQLYAHIGNIAEAISRDGVSSVVKLTYNGPFKGQIAAGSQWAVSKSIEGYRMLVDVTLGPTMDRYFMNKYNK